jgi:hypothetical protein
MVRAGGWRNRHLRIGKTRGMLWPEEAA